MGDFGVKKREMKKLGANILVRSSSCPFMQLYVYQLLMIIFLLSLSSTLKLLSLPLWVSYMSTRRAVDVQVLPLVEDHLISLTCKQTASHLPLHRWLQPPLHPPSLPRLLHSTTALLPLPSCFLPLTFFLHLMLLSSPSLLSSSCSSAASLFLLMLASPPHPRQHSARDCECLLYKSGSQGLSSAEVTPSGNDVVKEDMELYILRRMHVKSTLA